MGILNSLLARKKLSATSVKATIELHPDCMTVHAPLVPLYLSGSSIEVFNPNTQLWEYTDKPVFDPELLYRLKDAQQPVGINLPPQTATKRTSFSSEPPPTDNVGKFTRGQVYLANNGNRYLVLANKREIIDNYSVYSDPDRNPLVVMRWDTGVKSAVSTRTDYGRRVNSSKSKESNVAHTLVKKVDFVNLMELDGVNGLILLYRRNNATNVYLDSKTGEVKFM